MVQFSKSFCAYELIEPLDIVLSYKEQRLTMLSST